MVFCLVFIYLHICTASLSFYICVCVYIVLNIYIYIHIDIFIILCFESLNVQDSSEKVLTSPQGLQNASWIILSQVGYLVRVKWLNWFTKSSKSEDDFNDNQVLRSLSRFFHCVMLLSVLVQKSQEVFVAW